MPRTCNKVSSCSNPVTFDTLLKALFYTNGQCNGIMINMIAVDCEDLDPLINCGNQETTLEQLFNQSIVLDDTCGIPALNVFYTLPE
jgi:hypothetical protein